MSLERTCYLCGKPVSIRRQMSVFCSDRCELRFRALSREEPRDERAGAASPHPDGPQPPFPSRRARVPRAG